MGINLEMYKHTAFCKIGSSLLLKRLKRCVGFLWNTRGFLTRFPAPKKNQMFVKQLTQWDHRPPPKLLGTVLTWIKCCHKGRCSIIASNSHAISWYLLNQQLFPAQQWHPVDLTTKYTLTEISQGKDLFLLVKSASVQKGLFLES